jgi:phospholipid/cholesterol/gamma-HCH transport system permease protein
MLATAVPPEQQAKTSTMRFQATLLLLLRNCWLAVRDALTFFGEMALSCQRLMQRRANFRWQDFWFFVQQAGPGALGIISLVSVLAGVILAYLGAVQLRQFGAQVYVANLVSIGMTREMGALMTAIIMAGRTGAAYAAQLGTMQANEEIDALKIMGINPIDFLALPRTLALIMVMPLLTLYSDVLGMVGGSLIAGSMDIGFTQYISQTQESISMQQVFAGLFKSVVFALLIAEAGCYWGLKSGRSSTDVGITTTRAVVAALVAIIVADSLINVLYDRLHI